MIKLTSKGNGVFGWRMAVYMGWNPVVIGGFPTVEVKPAGFWRREAAVSILNRWGRVMVSKGLEAKKVWPVCRRLADKGCTIKAVETFHWHGSPYVEIFWVWKNKDTGREVRGSNTYF